MGRGVRVYLAMVATAATVTRISLAHDLVTPADHPEPSSLAKTVPPSPARAEEVPAPTSGDRRSSAVLLDLRTGVGLPLGEARTFATGRGAADVALGYLTGSGRYAGVTAGASELDSSLSGFHETTFQFGVDLGYRPTMRGKIEPWIGLGFAWQILWLTKADFNMKAVGPQFPIVRLGADYRLTDDVAIGPFAAFAYRRYDPFSVEGQTPLELTRVTRRDAWILLGVSASFWVSRL
jgi:hypothetical protein